MNPQLPPLVGVTIPTETCRDVAAALEREWLVTNGLGGYAFGTLAGALTRRYHGLLIAALKPPLGRTLLLSKIDEAIVQPNRRIPLYTNVWRTGVETPNACAAIRAFQVVDGAATWEFEAAGVWLRRRIWMEQGANITLVQYTIHRADEPFAMTLRVLAAHRDHHHTRPDDDRKFVVHADGSSLEARLASHDAGVIIRAASTAAGRLIWSPDHTWYRDFHLSFEQSVGYDHIDAHLCVGHGAVQLTEGDELTLICAVDSLGESWNPEQAWSRQVDWSARRRSAFHTANPDLGNPVPTAVEQLVLAADQFIVSRPMAEQPGGQTIIAGYPWFTDWGRDTMISLPGLTLVTGRPEVARGILLTWAKFVSQGMIPNRFPDDGETPDYNTADATLWYLWAVDQYLRATDDLDTLRELYPVLREIIAWHRRGTRYRIHLAEDGLLYAGEPGVQLTWMDAKIGDRVITPRIGKPIEINALWYDGLRNLAFWSERLSHSQIAAEFTSLADRARAGFERFWNSEGGGCCDRIDGPDGQDGRILPNQIFAVSLTHSPLPAEHQRAVVDAVQRELWTPFGLRTLSPAEPLYHGHCGGRLENRDEAYHQGTVWGWLAGPFALAHFRVYRDRSAALRLLAPMLSQLSTAGLGSLSEIFDGDAPHTPRGCVAQAWSVAETLRAWVKISGNR